MCTFIFQFSYRGEFISNLNYLKLLVSFFFERLFQKISWFNTHNLEIKFKLPSKIKFGDGTLTCTVIDGGVVESTGQTIPIILQKLDVKFYPEGGELVCGIPNNIYFESFTPFGDSADFIGQIIDSKRNPCSTIQTNHEGRGKSNFIPLKDEKYSLKVLSPSGVSFKNPLPIAKEEGVVVSSVCDVYEDFSSIKLKIGSSSKGKFKIGLFKKFKEISSQQIEFENSNEIKYVEFDISKEGNISQGVIRVTVFDEKEIPISERLIFIEPPISNTFVSIKFNKKEEEKYSVGEKVSLEISLKDSKTSKPIESLFGVSVVDESILEMINKRKQVPRLPFMIYLENEVERIRNKLKSK